MHRVHVQRLVTRPPYIETQNFNMTTCIWGSALEEEVESVSLNQTIPKTQVLQTQRGHSANQNEIIPPQLTMTDRRHNGDIRRKTRGYPP